MADIKSSIFTISSELYNPQETEEHWSTLPNRPVHDQVAELLQNEGAGLCPQF